MLADGRARRIEQRRLTQQYEGSIDDFAVPCTLLRCRDLVQRSAQMQRARAPAFVGLPWNRRRERPVHFERGHAVAIPLELLAIAPRECVASDLKQRPRREVAEDGLG